MLAKARKGLKKLLKEAEQQDSPDHTLVASHLQMGRVEELLGNPPPRCPACSTFVPLREREDFKKLLADLEKQPPPNEPKEMTVECS